MFTYVKAVVEKDNSNGQWMEENLAYFDVTKLLSYYKEVYVQVYNRQTDLNYWFNLRDMDHELKTIATGITLSDWIIARGITSYPFVDSPPERTIGVLRCNDAYVAGWTINSVHPSGTDLARTNSSEYSDILMSHDDVTYSDVAKRMLVTINGYVHQTFEVPTGLLVKGGTKSVAISGENNVGVLSFNDIGDITLLSIPEDEIYTPHAGGALIHEAWMKLNITLGDRIPLLCIGGCLIWDLDIIETVGIDILKININKIPLPEMYYQMRKHIDTSSADGVLFRDPSSPDNLRLSDLHSDDFVRKLLTLEQSFIILVDVNNLHVEKSKLEYTGLPGRFYCNQIPVGPVQTSMSRMPEYRAFPEDRRMVIAIQDNFAYRPLHDTYEWQKEVSVDNMNISSKPRYYSQGHLLHVYTILK